MPQEPRPEAFVQGPPAGSGHLGVEAGLDVLEQGQGPSAFEEPLGREVVARLAAEPRFRYEGIDRDRDSPPAAPGGSLPLVVPGQVMGAAGHQERAEPAPIRVQAAEVVALQQAGEQPLDQVLRRLRVVPLAADEGIERMPVVAAEPLERRARLRAAGSPASSTRPQQVVGNRAADGFSSMVARLSQVTDPHFCHTPGNLASPDAPTQSDGREPDGTVVACRGRW